MSLGQSHGGVSLMSRDQSHPENRWSSWAWFGGMLSGAVPPEPRARTGKNRGTRDHRSTDHGPGPPDAARCGPARARRWRRCAAGSFLHRFASLTRSNTDAFTGDRTSYEQLLQRVQPAHLIEWGDTPGQVLMLLSLDTERRDQLRLIAAPHGWPAPQPQPWDEYVAQHSDND